LNHVAHSFVRDYWPGVIVWDKIRELVIHQLEMFCDSRGLSEQRPARVYHPAMRREMKVLYWCRFREAWEGDSIPAVQLL
jgi:hypothetical protein